MALYDKPQNEVFAAPEFRIRALWNRALRFLLGDIFSNGVLGALAGTSCAALVGESWKMLPAMLVGTLLGMALAVPLQFVCGIFFGAFEVMLPMMLTGMMTGMVIAMVAATRAAVGTRCIVGGRGWARRCWRLPTWPMPFFRERCGRKDHEPNKWDAAAAGYDLTSTPVDRKNAGGISSKKFMLRCAGTGTVPGGRHGPGYPVFPAPARCYRH